MPLVDILVDGNTIRALSPVSQFRGPYEFGGLLWVVAIQDLGLPAPARNVRVYSSADTGLTWTEQDAANRPLASGTGSVYFDLAGGLLHIVLSDSVALVLKFVTFNLATSTWGAIVGGGPAIVPGGGVWMGRSSGGQFELMFAQVIAGFNRVVYGTYVGGVWGAPVQVSGLIDDLPAESQIAESFLVDSSDIIHCVWRSLGFANDTVWHRSVVGGVPAGAQQIYAQGVGATSHGLPSNMVEWNGQLAFGYARFNAGQRWPWIWYGTPSGVALPVWSEQAVSVAQNTAYGSANQHFQALTLRGADLYYWWATYNPGAGNMNSIYYAANAGGGWSAAVFYFTDAPSNPANDFFEQLSVAFLASGAWGVYHDRISAADGVSSVAAFIVDRPAPATSSTITQGGFRRTVVLVPNKFDLCLHRELQAHLHNKIRKACCEPILYRDIAWVRAPSNYIPFRKVGTVATPLAITGDVTVLDFQVPEGYDGLIAGLFNVYTGPGFMEGNGDIIWRILVNRTYAVQLGQILFTLGSRQQSYPVDGGIFIQGGTHIRYIVNVPNASGGILPLASQIVCGLEGLFYART